MLILEVADPTKPSKIEYMSCSSSQVIRMDIYEPFHHQVSMWEDNFKVDGTLNSFASSPMLMMKSSMDNKSECNPHELREPSGDDQETTDKIVPKGFRRLAQNREAARKCRLRKKAYVQQLETSRLKLMQLELEIDKARKQQGLYRSSSLDVSYMGSSAAINSAGISLFEIEYGRWVEEQDRQNEELRNALQSHDASDVQLNLLVESSLNHYSNLFRIKADAAKADVFYLISGAWKASIERLFLWIGGSRPSQLLNIIVPQLEALTDQQIASINNLRLSSHQAEDALSVGLEKLQQSMVHNIQSNNPLDVGNYQFQMAAAIDNGEALEGFVIQMDPFPELGDDPYVQECLSKYHTYHFEYVPDFTKQQLPVLFYADFCENFPSTIQLLDPKGNVFVVSGKENKGRHFMRYGSTRIGAVYNLFSGGWITLYFAQSTTFHMRYGSTCTFCCLLNLHVNTAVMPIVTKVG